MSHSLFVAWRGGTPDQGCWGPVGRLDHADGVYRFGYTRGAARLPGFVPFAGMGDLQRVYVSEQLFPLFANRLLARSRPEYEAYLTWAGFDHQAPPDPLAILGVTEGRRMTDSVEIFPCPQPDPQGRYACHFFLHGLRHLPAATLAQLADLRAGAALSLAPEPSNPRDPHAVAVYSADRVRIGYVPRFLARDVGALLKLLAATELPATVHRFNAGAPLQQRILCHLSAPWPAGFTPCAGDEFQLIAQAPARLAA